MADIPADPYGGDPMLKWFFEQQAMGAPAPMEPTASPLDFAAAPVPTEIAGPAGPSLPVPTDALAAPPPVETPALIDWAQGIPTEYAGLGPSPTGPDPLGAPPDAAAPPPDYQGFGPSPTPPPVAPLEHTGLGPALNAIGMPLPSAAIAEHVGYNAGEFSNADPMRRQAYLEEVAAKDPARFAQIQEAHKQIGEEEARAAQLDAARLNAQRAEAQYKAYTAATEHALKERDAVIAESKQLADTGIDRGRVWSRKSTGGKIASFLLAVVGGLVASRKGGPNTGLQMIMKEIDDDVEDQKAQIALKQAELGRRGGFASQAVSQAADAYRLGEVHRAAAYETVLREIEAKRASFDPRGTQALRLAQIGQEVRAAQTQALQAFTEKTQKTALETYKTFSEIAQKREDAAEKARHAKAEESNTAWGHSISASRLSFDKAKSDRDFKLDVRKEDRQDKELKIRQDELDQKRKDALEKEDRELGIGGVTKVELVDGMVPDTATGALKAGKVPKVTTGQLKNADGKVFQAPDQKTAQELRESRNGTQALVTILGDVSKLRARVGGTNKITSPNDDAEMKRLASQAVIELGKSKGISISDEQSVQLANTSIFGGDPTSYRADEVEERIRRTMSQAVANYHTKLKTANYTGPLPKFDETPPDVANSPQQERTKTILQAKAPSSGPRAKEHRLSDEAEAALVQTINEAALSKDEAVRQSARLELVNLAADRPDVSGAVIPRIYDIDPALVDAAAKRLPENRRAAIEAWKQLVTQYGRDFEALPYGLSNPLFNERYGQ